MTRVHIINHNVIPLKLALQRSVDLCDLGGTIRDAGAAMVSAGTHVIQLNELPTEHMVSDIEMMGMAIVRMANAIRLATNQPAKGQGA